jgi:hypothetical protein
MSKEEFIEKCTLINKCNNVVDRLKSSNTLLLAEIDDLQKIESIKPLLIDVYKKLEVVTKGEE